MKFPEIDLGAAASKVNRGFANWFANSFVMFVLFGLILGAMVVGAYYDGAYA